MKMDRTQDFTKELVNTLFVTTRNKATSFQPPTGVKVVGSNSRSVYKLYKKYACEFHGVDVIVTINMDGSPHCLGHWEFDEQLIEIRKGQSESSKLFTLAHEVGHILTYNAHCSDKTNEILAEGFACISLGVLGIEVRDYSYFNQFKGCGKVLNKYENLLKEALYDFISWVKGNVN